MAQWTARLRYALALAGTGLLAACGAETPITQNATVFSTSAGQTLTAPSRDAPFVVVKKFLASQGLAKQMDSLLVKREGPGANRALTHLRIEQRIDGLRVMGAYVKATVNDRGELLHLIDNAARIGKALPASKSDEPAVLGAVLRHQGNIVAKAPARTGRHGNLTTFARGTYFYSEPSVERVVYMNEAGKAEAGFLVETWSRTKNILLHTLVSDSLEIVSVEKRTANDSYNVFTEDPSKGGQTIVTGVPGWLAAGAQYTTRITGNNTKAYLDVDNNNAPDTASVAVTDGNFLTAANLGAPPASASNREVAVQNLFYLTNVVHDTLYQYGFNEAAGNFQTNNFSLGGVGNDPLNAEAQDGGGLDNANMSTPADGSSPRMQMYLWSGVGPTHEAFVNGTSFGGAGADFGVQYTTTGVSGPLGVMIPADGCTAAAVGSLTGKVAIMDRGTCNFDAKVKNAQLGGAIAAIVVNNDTVNPAAFFRMAAGTAKGIKIGAIMVSYNDGATLKGSAGASSIVRKKVQQPLHVDGSLDADIVFHEFGHGLTWRMIGGMSGPLAGAIGEGASDVVAFLLNGDDRIGEYAYSDARGIRRYPYANYPLTYANVGNQGFEVHNDGEIYGGAMWRLKESFALNGIGVEQLFSYFVDGMNYTPATPAFEHMRDGMLQSAATAGLGHECHIWRAFAASGVGVGAKANFSRRGALQSITQSFTVPGTCL